MHDISDPRLYDRVFYSRIRKFLWFYKKPWVALNKEGAYVRGHGVILWPEIKTLDAQLTKKGQIKQITIVTNGLHDFKQEERLARTLSSPKAGSTIVVKQGMFARRPLEDVFTALKEYRVRSQ